MTKNFILPLFILIIFLVVGIGSLLTIRAMRAAPDQSPTGEYRLIVEEGAVLESISQILYTDNVIASPQSLRLESSLFTPLKPLQIGEYVLQVPAGTESLITQINEQSDRIQAANRNAVAVEGVTVTIREGLTLDSVFTILEQKGVASADELKLLANDYTKFRDQYEFLPTPLNCTYGDLKTCAKYYLEGYVYPDTYTFPVTATAQDVLETMLDNFNTKVYAKVAGEQTPDELYKTLILASVVERETGRTKGVTDATAPELAQERSIMADVFINRIELGMKWQSDPTVTYGTGFQVCQQTFEIEGCVFLDDTRVQTLYNTYRISGYPVGPTTSPQWSVIQAVLNPEPNDYLYFVSDVTGKKYFAATEADHYKNIEYVTNLNRRLNNN